MIFLIHTVVWLFQKTKGWEGRKTVALYGKKQKLNHVTRMKADTISDPGLPFSVRELNFLPLSQAQPAGKTSASHFIKAIDNFFHVYIVSSKHSGGLGEFLKVMQTLDCILGFHISQILPTPLMIR